MNQEIKPNQIYTTGETQEYLRISKSTIKRLLKKGILKANKVGGRYKILGSEVLMVVSPKVETKVRHLYCRLKDKTKNVIGRW
jgi:excisionase family DNA binding protein